MQHLAAAVVQRVNAALETRNAQRCAAHTAHRTHRTPHSPHTAHTARLQLAAYQAACYHIMLICCYYKRDYPDIVTCIHDIENKEKDIAFIAHGFR